MFTHDLESGELQLSRKAYNAQRFIRKVFLHVTIKIKYRVRKNVFIIASAFGIDSSEFRKKRIAKYLPNDYLPDVFLRIPLTQVDETIKSDQLLRDIIMKEGEASYNGEWLILNSRRKQMYDHENGHYRWTEDFFTNFKFNNCFFMDARRQKMTPNTDIKVPWETARMQSLFSLGLAYRATKNEKYAKRIIEIINDFYVCCPYDNGVNWNVSMEVGIRISNILLACELIKDSKYFDQSFKRLFAVMVYEHMIHIRKNMENEKDGGNHLLADLLGLAATSASMPFLPGARSCASYVQKMLRQELMRQLLPDGGHFEGSVSYHRLVGEILCFSVIAQQKIGFSLTEKENERLIKMGEFTSGLRMENGLVPQFGDNDSGRVFQLAPENTRNHDSFINLVSSVTRGTIVYPNIKDGFFVFYTYDLLTNCNCFMDSYIRHYLFFKIIRYQKNGLFLAFCGMTPEDVNKVGRSHNDILSFCLAVGGEEFIIDPGSGEYTGNHDIRHSLRSVNNHSTVSIDGNEQRLKPDNPSHVFKWDSTAESYLKWGKKDNDIIMIGKCSYKALSGRIIEHERKIVISESSIQVHDSINSIENECTITLPVFPNLTVEMCNNTVFINGKMNTIRISGSWIFDIDCSLFSEQYKKIEPNTIIHGTSASNDNWMLIEILKMHKK